MKKIIIILIVFLSSVSVHSQNTLLNGNFDCQIRKSVGDLNNDGLMDKVVISMDTINDTRPMLLEIFFLQPNKKYKLLFSSTEIIEAMYPIEKNGESNGNQIPDVYIDDGKLQIDFYIDGNSSYEFIHKDGVFELIHFSYVNRDAKIISETEFDLLTGKYSKQSEILNTSEITIKIDKKVLIRPLPLLKNFMPFENELY